MNGSLSKEKKSGIKTYKQCWKQKEGCLYFTTWLIRGIQKKIQQAKSCLENQDKDLKVKLQLHISMLHRCLSKNDK